MYKNNRTRMFLSSPAIPLFLSSVFLTPSPSGSINASSSSSMSGLLSSPIVLFLNSMSKATSPILTLYYLSVNQNFKGKYF